MTSLLLFTIHNQSWVQFNGSLLAWLTELDTLAHWTKLLAHWTKRTGPLD